MKFLNPILCTFFVAFVFTSCKSIPGIIIPNGSDTLINIPPKKGSLSDEEIHKWSHMDLETDSIPGMSIDKAYKFVKNKKGVEVIVAIADSGIDVEHEDLKDVVWINPNEIAGNNIDDDKNGYVDDMNGWNFLGNAAGEIVIEDQLEITRIVKKGTDKFGKKKASEIEVVDKEEFQQYLKLKEEFLITIEKQKVELEELENIKIRLKDIEENFKVVKKFIQKDTFTLEDLKLKPAPSLKVAFQVSDVANLIEKGMSEKELLAYKKEVLERIKSLKEEKKYDLFFHKRQSLGDDLYDITDKFYGNNNVIGNKDLESHGTHVAGIVAASRDNGKGVNGVANNVKIMAVRIVPNGDEHDKDIALGIRYAVDNGAKIINTSFGKRFSPNKQWVYDAINYAAKNDVLIVNAAGNDSKNIDVSKTYPNDSKDLLTEFTDNVITVGAISLNYDENLLGSFSNFGKINVDIFAPGVKIYATMPKDEYKLQDGTSMAAPSVAGVAALIRSYYPQLTASQVKHILMNSGVKIDFKVIKPGTLDVTVPFADLSVSGRIVNAYNALKMADRIIKIKNN